MNLQRRQTLQHQILVVLLGSILATITRIAGTFWMFSVLGQVPFGRMKSAEYAIGGAVPVALFGLDLYVFRTFSVSGSSEEKRNRLFAAVVLSLLFGAVLALLLVQTLDVFWAPVGAWKYGMLVLPLVAANEVMISGLRGDHRPDQASIVLAIGAVVQIPTLVVSLYLRLDEGWVVALLLTNLLMFLYLGNRMGIFIAPSARGFADIASKTPFLVAEWVASGVMGLNGLSLVYMAKVLHISETQSSAFMTALAIVGIVKILPLSISAGYNPRYGDPKGGNAGLLKNVSQNVTLVVVSMIAVFIGTYLFGGPVLDLVLRSSATEVFPFVLFLIAVTMLEQVGQVLSSAIAISGKPILVAASASVQLLVFVVPLVLNGTPVGIGGYCVAYGASLACFAMTSSICLLVLVRRRSEE